VEDKSDGRGGGQTLWGRPRLKWTVSGGGKEGSDFENPGRLQDETGDAEEGENRPGPAGCPKMSRPGVLRGIKNKKRSGLILNESIEREEIAAPDS